MHIVINTMLHVQLNAARKAAKASMESTGVPMILDRNFVQHALFTDSPLNVGMSLLTHPGSAR